MNKITEHIGRHDVYWRLTCGVHRPYILHNILNNKLYTSIHRSPTGLFMPRCIVMRTPHAIWHAIYTRMIYGYDI